MQGQISAHPLAELIREIVATGLTGALRLERERAKVVIYFDAGELIFATSNLRAHRLRQVVMRHGLDAEHLSEFPVTCSDNELAAAMLDRRLLKPETLAAIRSKQVGDVLRLALLWIDGAWEFDPRVRLADQVEVEIDVKRLLLECARHLPEDFVASRLQATTGTYSKVGDNSANGLVPAEQQILSRASGFLSADELSGAVAAGEAVNAYRAIYALSLSGLLERSEWPLALAVGPRAPVRKPRATIVPTSAPAPSVPNDEADLEGLFGRLDTAKDHYEVINVGRMATIDEIKNAYHALALRFHPDRFHQSDPQLRTRVESAFARIARAYEVLSDRALRADYDNKRTSKPSAPTSRAAKPEAMPNGKQTPPRPEAARAETSFQHGVEALKNNRQDEAIRFLAEAAMLSPREARYRAHYGQALSRQPNTRRMAETELQAALSQEPENTSYRVMLAELYKQLGLQKRAEGELERALAFDPNHAVARSLLANLRSKKPKS